VTSATYFFLMLLAPLAAWSLMYCVAKARGWK
jgi:hypothetical protein